MFTLAGEWLAVDAKYLVEVLEPVHVSLIPLVPDFVDGLINVNGDIIPQIDLLRFCSDEQAVKSDELSTLLVVNVQNNLLALKVGVVQEPLEVTSSDFMNIGDPDSDIWSQSLFKQDYFSQLLDYQHATAKVFSLDSLDDVIRSESKPESEKGFLGDVVSDVDDQELALEYLKVMCQGQVYACLLSDVYEVVDVESIQKQPSSPLAVLGVTLIRSMPTLVLSLNCLLQQRQGLPIEEPHLPDSDYYSLLLMRSGDVYCGLWVDKVLGLTLVNRSQLRPGKHDWEQVLLAEDQHMLAQGICLKQLFNEHLSQEFLPYMPSLEWAQQQRIKRVELLRFYIEGDGYAFYLNDVRRVISDKTIQPLLESQAFMVGAVEFEGHVIPVVDLSLQLGYAALSKINEFIVVNDGDRDWALAIPKVEKIINVKQPSIDRLSLDDDRQRHEQRPVVAYTTFAKQLLSILDVKVICNLNLMQRSA